MNANQPAYPCVWYDFQPTTGEQVVREHFGGLTKREEFAKAAMQGLLSNPVASGEMSMLELVESSIETAETLLAELEKEVKP